MSAKRLYQVLGAIALVALLTLAGRTALGAGAAHVAKDVGGNNQAKAQPLNIDSPSRSFHTPQTSNYEPIDRSFHTPQTSNYGPIDRSFHTPQTSNYTP